MSKRTRAVVAVCLFVAAMILIEYAIKIEPGTARHWALVGGFVLVFLWHSAVGHP